MALLRQIVITLSFKFAKHVVIASEAKQSSFSSQTNEKLDCFASLAMTYVGFTRVDPGQFPAEISGMTISDNKA